MLRLLQLLLGLCLFAPRTFAATPIQYAGAPNELVISRVGEHTLRFQLTPLNEHVQPLPGSVDTVLAPLSSQEVFRARDLARIRELRAGQVRIRLQPQPLTISLRRTGGHLIQELTFEEGTNAALAFRTDAPVFGLGEGEQQFDRRGKLYPMINGQLAPLLATHGATIPVPFLIGADGWSMFIHQPLGQVDLRQSSGRFLPKLQVSRKEPLDIFISDAPAPAEVMAEYIRLTGQPVMPPRWALGYLQSHRTLAGPDEPLQIARSFREKHLPCDGLIYLGTGYCTNGWNTGHGSLQFNPNSFPHPAEQIRALHDLNFKIILHINHAPRDLFGTTLQPLPPHSSHIAEDFSSPLHILNYWARHREVFGLGIDGWWPDDGDELPIEARLARHRCYYEGPLLDRPNVRPWSLHRNGYAGVARYGGWIWSGDTMSRWATLAAHVPVALNYSLSVTPFWGSDTGGFVATKELTGELYTRWFQFSAFNPLFRSHGRTWHLRLPFGWNTGEYGPIETQGRPEPSELHNPEVEPICRKYLELRYRLLPYNYTLMREACDSGLPPMRALWLHYPEDPEAVKLGDEYLWGRDLLVAPVVEQGARIRRVYLPAGVWYDWWTGEKITGPRWIERPVELAVMPLYVRAGAIVPLDPVRQFTGEKVNEPTTLRVYPGADGAFVLYEDDGTSLDYQRNLATWTRITWDDRKRRLTIEPDSRSKIEMPAPRKFDILVEMTGARGSLVYGGKRVQMKFETKE